MQTTLCPNTPGRLTPGLSGNVIGNVFHPVSSDAINFMKANAAFDGSSDCRVTPCEAQPGQWLLGFVGLCKAFGFVPLQALLVAAFNQSSSYRQFTHTLVSVFHLGNMTHAHAMPFFVHRQCLYEGTPWVLEMTNIRTHYGYSESTIYYPVIRCMCIIGRDD